MTERDTTSPRQLVNRAEADRGAAGGRALRTPARGLAATGAPGPGLRFLNVAGALVAIGYAVHGVWTSSGPRGRAALATPPVEERFWAAQSGVRTAAVSLPLLVGAARSAPDPGVLVVAGLVQLGDSGVGVWSRKPGMALAPLLMALVHLATARRVGTAGGPARARPGRETAR